MQPLAFLASSLRTTLTSTQLLPKILEKHGQRPHLFQKTSQEAELWLLESFLHSANIFKHLLVGTPNWALVI